MITEDTITDRDIQRYLDSLTRGHWHAQICADALGSFHHPMRKRNCRRMVAEFINESREVVS